MSPSVGSDTELLDDTDKSLQLEMLETVPEMRSPLLFSANPVPVIVVVMFVALFTTTTSVVPFSVTDSPLDDPEPSKKASRKNALFVPRYVISIAPYP